LPHPTQDIVADVRTVARADLTESVDVEEDEAERCGLASGAGELQVEHAVERASIGEAGQGVGVSEPVVPVGPLHERLLEACRPDSRGGQVADRVEATDEVRGVAGIGRLLRQAGHEEALDLLGAGAILRHERHQAHGLDVACGSRQGCPHGLGHWHDLRAAREDRGGDRVAGLGRGRDGERRDGLDREIADAGAAAGHEHGVLTVEEVDQAARGTRDGAGCRGQSVELLVKRAGAGEEPRARGQRRQASVELRSRSKRPSVAGVGPIAADTPRP
jgi:hypothetical protein